MLTREELEGFSWRSEGYQTEDEKGMTVGGVIPELARLMAAAPALALACLDACEEMRQLREETAGHAAAEHFEGLRANLAAALSAAGVEVPDSETKRGAK